MLPDEQVIVMELRRLYQAVPGFVLEFMSGDMDPSDEQAFALRLTEAAERINQHAHIKADLILDGTATKIPEPARLILLPGRNDTVSRP